MYMALRIYIVFMFFVLSEAYSVAQNSAYDISANEQRTEVNILAISSSIHTGGSGNQEVYLADVKFKDHNRELLKLVDSYPSMDSPILRTVLTERHALQMTLIRDPQCDTTGQHFFLASDDRNISMTAPEQL